MYILFILLFCLFKESFTLDVLDTRNFEDLEKWEQDLLISARDAREKAYSPYSGYLVGAAVRTSNGLVYKGANVENMAYGSTSCAERSAVYSAVSAGTPDIIAVAIVTKDCNTPCGPCRQVLNEFNSGMMVYLADIEMTLVRTAVMSDLLPNAFISAEGPTEIYYVT